MLCTIFGKRFGTQTIIFRHSSTDHRLPRSFIAFHQALIVLTASLLQLAAHAFFCEECDAIAVSPLRSPHTADHSAIIRAETTDGPFICPMYRNTLSIFLSDTDHLVVPSHPQKLEFFRETNRTDRPTSMDSAPDSLEIDRLNWPTSLIARYVVLSSMLSQAHIVLETSSSFLP